MTSMDGWWIDVERAASLLALLAREGKIRICSVEGPAPIAEG